MPGRDEHASGRWGNGPRGRISGAVLLIAALTCTLEAESPATKANYSVDNWLLADGEDRDAEEIAANSPFRCDLTGCNRQGEEGQDHCARPPSGGARGGLPYRRYRHRAIQRRQRVQHGTRGGRPARATGRRRACDLCRGAVDQERERCRDARAEALGAGACPSEAVSAGWPGLRPRSRCRRRRG